MTSMKRIESMKWIKCIPGLRRFVEPGENMVLPDKAAWGMMT